MTFFNYVKLFFKLPLKRSFKNLLNNKHTYCHHLWETSYINDNGDVYVCCHCQPSKIGNIYEQKLADIWHSSSLQLFRMMSKFNCLGCFESCGLISKEHKNSKTKQLEYNVYPKRLHINISEFCNISCIMCRQDHRSKVSIDTDKLKENVDWEHVEVIILQGGEILALNKAKEFYLYLTSKLGKKIKMITNGLLIDDEWATHLVKGSNQITISVNASTAATHELVNKGSKFTKVIENIQKLIRIKLDLKSDVIIEYRFTIVPENFHEVAKAIYLANKLGCDKIFYGYDYGMLPYLEANPQVKESMIKELSLVKANDLNIIVDDSGLIKLGLGGISRLCQIS